jgi:photosystem II stability/assembly factor-like uncharacterized protein
MKKAFNAVAKTDTFICYLSPKSFMQTSTRFVLTVLLFSHVQIFAQSTEKDILNAFAQRQKAAETSLLKDYPARNIGPTVQGGRIVDIDVNSKNTKEFYVAYGSAGIFKTINNGISFEPYFDNNGALGIGDFALSQTDPAVMYVGTGEKNSSRSSYAGSGVYKTTDGGKTWAHLGLTGTQHISRVLIHPKDNNIAWVAAIGSLYTNNSERGVFKTVDGGKTWKKTLYINDSTGVIDLTIDVKNPDHLLASAWERSRKAWQFKGNGQSSGIYVSNDGGQTWKKSTSGFAEGKSVGRIGLDVSASDPNIVYAILDNQLEVEDKQKVKKVDDKLKPASFKSMTNEDVLKLDEKKLDEFLKDNGYPKKYTAEVVKKDIRSGKYGAKDIASYFGGDANANLFETKILGAQVYRSSDGGSSWKKMNSYDLDGVFYTYGYYFAEMRVAPDNPDLIYIYGVPMLKSRDGGATWHRIDTLSGINSVHVDHHALWINPNDSRHMLLGNDGGLYQTYDEGANWLHINNTSVGQFYTVNVDMETPYNVYGGLQDNGVLKGSSKSVPNQSKQWEQIFGGDGMYVAPDPRNNKIVYTGFQFGNYYKLDLDKGKTTKITPQHNIGEQPLRWNWRAPLIQSKHNNDIIYIAANKVYRSLNKGENWEAISDDLTKNVKQGNVPFSTISSLSESSLKFGLLYAGTDDGNVWVSRDAGGEWQQINKALPPNKWISSLIPSPHNEGTVFISLNGYRDDDFNTYLFRSDDYGNTWTDITGNLPESVANVVIQDPVNPDLLYCGLDQGTFVSIDKGVTWHLFNAMLNVSSYDMMVHPRENELVVGTHGRSVFVADVKPLQAMKDGGSNKAIIAFAPESIRFDEQWGEKEYPWDKVNFPEISIFYYIGKQAPSINVEVFDEKNNLVKKLTSSGTSGFHTLSWDCKVDAVRPSAKTKSKEKPAATSTDKFLSKGKYKLKFTNGSESSEVTLEIK